MTHAPEALVVDDNADSADMFAEILQAMGYQAHVAYDAPAALRLAGDHAFDLALLDIGLPVMNGYELARRLRALPNGTRTRMVAVTGFGDAGDVHDALDAGFDAHVVKPVSLERLEKIVRG